MAVTLAGLSTLGITFSYGIETTAGEKPDSFTLLERCSEISGISLDTEQIDVSTLEDYVSKYVAGRQDTGGTWDVTFNITDETIEQLSNMMEASSEAQSNGLQTWFQVSHPNMEKAFFVIAEPGTQIPLPDMGQNEALTGAITLIIVEYMGLDEKVEPVES